MSKGKGYFQRPDTTNEPIEGHAKRAWLAVARDTESGDSAAQRPQSHKRSN